MRMDLAQSQIHPLIVVICFLIGELDTMFVLHQTQTVIQRVVFVSQKNVLFSACHMTCNSNCDHYSKVVVFCAVLRELGSISVKDPFESNLQ